MLPFTSISRGLTPKVDYSCWNVKSTWPGFFLKSNLGFLMWQSVYSIPKQIKQCVKDTCGLYRPPDLRTCCVHSSTRESLPQEAPL